MVNDVKNEVKETSKREEVFIKSEHSDNLITESVLNMEVIDSEIVK